MKVILAAVNAKYIHSNLAVYSLKAYAEKYREHVELAEYTINQQADDILRDLYKKRPDILCLSCYIWNLSYVEELVKEIKKVLPELIIWLGGPEVSYDAAEVLKRLPEVQGVMKGEGEETFLELLEHYIGKTMMLGEITGITFRDGEQIVENAWREPLDLDCVPFVYGNIKEFEHKIIYYETSRGCPFSCSYCLSSIDKRLRFRSFELVKKELQFFLDNKVPQVKFVDRTFNCRHEHAQAIWNYILEHDNGITNFHFEVAADILSEEEIRIMEKMRPGLIQLEIGVQSTNEETVKEIRRTMDFEKVAEIVKRINAQENVHQHLDLIAGLPGEDYESFGRSFDDVYGLSPEQLQLGFLKVLKGSYMEQNKKAYGLVYKNKPPYEVMCTNWLSYEEVIRLKGIEEMVEVYYNSGQFAYTLKHLVPRFETPFAFFEALASWYEERGLYQVSHSRITRYEVLLEFARAYDREREDLYRELLTLDLYLRENVKNRPEFAGESFVTKEEQQSFYNAEEEEHKYLKGYDSYDRRQLRKMTHMEKFRYDVMGQEKEVGEKETLLLFDYQNRSPLNRQAAVFEL